MVKIIILLFISFTLSFASPSKQTNSNDLLMQKIHSLLDDNTFKQNKAFIEIIFSPKSNYYYGDRVDVIKVIKTLKENGLLELYFKRPSEFVLDFKTSANPMFFVKIMSDTLRDMGYYRYVTNESSLNSSEFNWSVSLVSEYATDPIVLQKELSKRGCKIVDIQRLSPFKWRYNIDMRDAHLDVIKLDSGEEMRLRRSLYDYWLDVSKIKRLDIKSSFRNSWYPHIVYYDSSLHLLKVIKNNKKHYNIHLDIPSNAMYVKITDIWTLKNIKDGLRLYPKGSR